MKSAYDVVAVVSLEEEENAFIRPANAVCTTEKGTLHYHGVFLWWQQQLELSPYQELFIRNSQKQNLGYFLLCYWRKRKRMKEAATPGMVLKAQEQSF